MQLEIISPDEQLFKGEVNAVTFPGKDGRFGVLNDHAPLISSLQAGPIGIEQAGKEKTTLDVKGGVVEVLNNKVMVLAE